MRKKLGVFMLVAAMGLSMVACGKSEEETTAAATKEATTEATNEAATDADTTEAAPAAAGEETELEMKHGIYTIKYDSSVYRPATDDDMFGDLIPLDETKYPKLYVTTLSGEDWLHEKMDEVKEKMGSDPEEITVDGHTAYLYKYEEEFMGYSYDCIIPFNGVIKSADGYYNNEAGVYIYGSANTEDMIYNDVILNIFKSVDIDESLEDAAADEATEEEAAAAASADEFGTGKSTADATGNVDFDTLKATYDWANEAGFGMTYEEFKDKLGVDGEIWVGNFSDTKHGYKWHTEDGAEFLAVTFAVNEDGSETMSSYSYSTGLKDQ